MIVALLVTIGGIGPSCARDFQVAELVVGRSQVRAAAVVAAGPAAVGDRAHLLLGIAPDRVEDRADAGACATPFPLQEVGGLLGGGDRIAERLVERDLACAAVEVADVQPVEVARCLPGLRGAARLLRKLPRRDHAWVKAGELRQASGELLLP